MMAYSTPTAAVLPADQHHVLSVLSLDASFTVPGIVKRAYQPLDAEKAHDALTALINGGLVREHNEHMPEGLQNFVLTVQGTDALAADKRAPRVLQYVSPLDSRILHIISEEGQCYGTRIAELEGTLAGHSSSLYLSRLRKRHLVIDTQRKEQRRYFSLTSLGKRALTDVERCPRISRLPLLLLGTIIMMQEAYALQVCDHLQGMVSTGSIYQTLGRMVNDDYIEVTRTEERPLSIGPPLKYYRPTDHGMSVYRYWVSPEEASG